MPFDSDVALIGTGAAPLVAASHLLAQGKSVLLLNPDFDFFLEDSELPLDPMIASEMSAKRLAKSWPERALGELRPDFPGAVEFWSGSDAPGFHDVEAPHVRQRSWLWMASNIKGVWNWERLEDAYVESSDAGLKPQILDGLQAAKRFPGFSGTSGDFRGLMVPKLCDVDVSRYRNGLLEFVRERLGNELLVNQATQIELMPGGLRFYSANLPRTARINEGTLVFWTPRMTSWVTAQAKKAEVSLPMPAGVRLWEEWSLLSRESLDPATVGFIDDMAVWTEIEGTPSDLSGSLHRMAVLKSGAKLPLQFILGTQSVLDATSFATVDSFNALSHLCHDFLKWERFSVRSMKPRIIFDWPTSKQEPAINSGFLSEGHPFVQVISRCDGPLVEVVRNARLACERFVS